MKLMSRCLREASRGNRYVLVLTPFGKDRKREKEKKPNALIIK